MWGMHVVVVGSPFDEGMEIFGPFKTGDEAVAWAEQNCDEQLWWAVPLHEPGSE